MKEVYNELFNKIASRMSDEELLGRVLNSRKGDHIMDNNMDNNKKNTKKRGMKLIVAPLAAAIVAAGTAVGAVAVYNRNINQELNNMLVENTPNYGIEYKDTSGAVVEPEKAAPDNELYEKMNITIGAVYDELDDVRIEIPGAICDGKDMLVLYDVIFDKDLGFFDDGYQHMSLDGVSLQEGLRSGSRSSRGKWTMREGKKVYTNYCSFSGVENFKDKLMVKFDGLFANFYSPGMTEYSKRIDFDVEIPLTNDFSKVNRTLTANNAQAIDLNSWGKWEVTAAEISALTLRVDIKADGAAPEGNIFKTTLGAVFPIEVTFKDGSKLEMDDRAITGYHLDDENQTGYFYVPLNLPIDVDDVQSVQFASAVINEDGTATTVEIPAVVDRYKPSKNDQK